jgi:hypothetical protein
MFLLIAAAEEVGSGKRETKLPILLAIQKGLLNLPRVECLTLVSRYSGARGFSGALGFSAMLRYAVAGQDNALGSSVATLSTNCDAGPVLQFALMVGASATPTPTR